MANDSVEVMIRKDLEWQGQKNDKENTQREIHTECMTIKDLVGIFTDLLRICVPHYQEICWIRLIPTIDFAIRIRYTPHLYRFLSTMALRAFQTKNSSVGGLAVNDNFVYMYMCRNAKVKVKRK